MKLTAKNFVEMLVDLEPVPAVRVPDDDGEVGMFAAPEQAESKES